MERIAFAAPFHSCVATCELALCKNIINNYMPLWLRVLEQTLLLTAYMKSYMRNRLVP